jgi:hypothetical protein
MAIETVHPKYSGVNLMGKWHSRRLRPRYVDTPNIIGSVKNY